MTHALPPAGISLVRAALHDLAIEAPSVRHMDAAWVASEAHAQDLVGLGARHGKTLSALVEAIDGIHRVWTTNGITGTAFLWPELRRQIGKECERVRNEFPVPASQCPRCSFKLDRATGFDMDARPVPDDLSICLECMGVNRFNQRLDLVAMTDDDLAKLDDATLDVIGEIRGAMVRASTRGRRERT